MIGISEFLAFSTGILAMLYAAAWGNRYGCFAAIGCGLGAGVVGFVLGYCYWQMVEELGHYAVAMRSRRRMAGAALTIIYALAMLLPMAAVVIEMRLLPRLLHH